MVFAAHAPDCHRSRPSLALGSGWRHLRVLAVALLVFSGAACGSSPTDSPPAPTPAASTDDSAPPPRTVATTDASKAADSLEDIWDICVIQGSKVGYAHTVIREVEDEGRKLLQIELDQFLSLRRFGQATVQQLSLTSFETPTGELVRFESRLTAGQQLTLTRGHVRGDQLQIEVTTPGKTQRTELPWSKNSGGFFTAELELRRNMLKPGQKRTHKVLLPALNQPGETQLEGLVYESVTVGGESRQLLKVRKVDVVGGNPIESFLWVDPQGVSWKTLLVKPPPGIETRRASRAEALAESDLGAFDLGASSMVKISKPIRQPHATRKIVYRATVTDGKAAKLFAAGPSQVVRGLDDGSAEIEVLAIRGHDPKTVEGGVPPTDEDRAPNNLIQSDAPRIKEMAVQIAPAETDSWKLAQELERFVRRTITSKNFSQAFATAAEVAETKTGDCTEHAVLLAALCRARGLPARVAIGLVYSAELGGFAYHMWNEVWIDDRWVPLDATLGLGGIGGAHLKLLTSSLQGYDAYGVFLPVFQVLGQLKLEVLQVEGPTAAK